MSLTSLGISSRGLLDGGSKPMLHLATEGLIRLGGAIIPPDPDAGGGGGGIHIDRLPRADGIVGGIRGPVGRRSQSRTFLTLAEIKARRLEELRKQIKVAPFRDLIEPLPVEQIDIKALQAIVDEALAELPPSRRKVDLENVDVADLLIDGNMRLRLLLLLGA